jgi:hypothetical protein
VIDAYGIGHIASSSFKDTSPTLFWNLIWHLTNQKLQVDFIVEPEQYIEPSTPAPTPAKRSRAKKSTRSSSQLTGRSTYESTGTTAG